LPGHACQFPGGAMLKMYASTMRGLGIDIDKLTNIHIDIEPRAGKNPRAACFRINAPFDVRMCLSPVGGPLDYAVFFHEVGHAQHFAWSSKSLVERYPEFLFAPENATSEGYAFLFSHLFHDPAWISEFGPGIRRDDAKSVSRSFAFLTLGTVRRYCAKLRYEIRLHSSSSLRSAELAGRYADLQKQATVFGRPSSMYLSDVDDGFYAAAYLRAWSFEAGLREHLLMRHGRRWWESRKAGEELIDLWNTSSRYTVDELASMIGFSPLNFDLLADLLSTALKED
jgi:hypothetical protein